MTDTFASEPRQPSSASLEATGEADVTETLVDLERKLRELERELTSIGQRRAQGAPPDAQEVSSSSPAVAPRSPAAPPPPSPSPPTGRLVDEAIAVDSTETFERTGPSDAQLASLAELRRFRDRLERFARDLAGEYDALLGRVMTGLSSTSPRSAFGSPVAAPRASTPVPPTVTAPTPAPAPPSTPTPTAPLASAPTLAPTPPPTPTPPNPDLAATESRENALFEGRVELGVGPFYDIASLGAFERRLISLPGVSEASVRRFEASHAVLDVRLAAPVALVRELRRTAGSDFSVREVSSGRILLTFDEP